MSAAPHCQIGRVRMKAGGAEVRVIRQPDAANNLRGVIVDHARKLANMGKPGGELVGFVWIGLYGDGTSSVGCRYDPKTSPIPRALLPAYVEEVIRRDLVTAAEAEDVACKIVNRANGFDV